MGLVSGIAGSCSLVLQALARSFDVGQFRLDWPRSGVVFPDEFESEYLIIKQVFADWKGVRRCGMTAALDLLGLPLSGTHHRGDDARNIARILQGTLPNVVVA